MKSEGEIKYAIGNSLIHGQGVIAQCPIKKGEVIGVAVPITPGGHAVTQYLGRYVNHSSKPNSCLKLNGLAYDLVAITDISIHEEIAADYNSAPDFIAKPDRHFI